MIHKVQQSNCNTTFETLDAYDLGGVDCELCHNTGSVAYEKDGIMYGRPCECMKTRRTLKAIRNSGLGDMLQRYTFDSYETPDPKRTGIKARAEKFCSAPAGWWYIGGKSGSGKTHICTAICGRLIESGNEVRYILWRDFAREMKAGVNDDDYQTRINKLKQVKVLYIDDLFKGKITEADVNLAFELINARYNNTSLRTVISSEFTTDDLINIDEAICGRIKERAKGYEGTAPAENWRLK